MATVGCDPEVLLISNTGAIIRARDIFGRATNNVSPRHEPQHIPQATQALQRVEVQLRGDPVPREPVLFPGYGSDGAGTLAEIRPMPSFNPRDVVKSIGNLLREMSENSEVRKYHCSMYVGSYHQSCTGIGGHLHGWGRTNTRTKLESDNNRYGVCYGLTYLWQLEDWDTGYMRRHTSPYGAGFDTRKGNTTPTYEFRSPSSDWMAYPQLAYHSLMLFRSLVDNCQDLGRYFRQNDSNVLSIVQNYWDNRRTPTTRQNYMLTLDNVIASATRAEDRKAITFFASKLEKLRGQYKLIKIDPMKWWRNSQ